MEVTTVGESVLRVLEGVTDELIALAGTYAGSGRWPEETQLVAQDLLQDRVRHYWTAVDWYGASGVDWSELAQEAGVDPERALGDAWAEAVTEVAAWHEKNCDEKVSEISAYVRSCAEEYKSSHQRERAGE